MDIGARLRDARESRGLTLDAVARSTRVQSRMLSAIERNDSVSLPPRPYASRVRPRVCHRGRSRSRRTVREFFSQFGVTEPTPSYVVHDPNFDAVRTAEPQQWVWPVAAVVGYALVGALVIFAGRWAIQRSAETSGGWHIRNGCARGRAVHGTPARARCPNTRSGTDERRRDRARRAERLVDHRQRRRRTGVVPVAPARRTDSSRWRPCGQHPCRRCRRRALASQRREGRADGTIRRSENGQRDVRECHSDEVTRTACGSERDTSTLP